MNNLTLIKNEIKANLSLSLPLVASQLVYNCSVFIGTVMVAHLGEDALAASVLVSMIWMTLTVLFFGLLNAVTVLVSHQFGADNRKEISRIMGQAFLLGVLVCLIMLMLLYFMPLLLHWSGQPPAVLIIATQYMHALLWTVPALILLIIYEQFLVGIHQTKLVLHISLVVVPLEIPLIYLLVFGKWGMPACGVAGIAYGFAITYTLTAIGLILYLVKSKFYRSFGLFKGITKINPHYFKELIKIGLPMGFMHVIEISAFAVATFWMGQFGTTVLAAHQIVFQYLSFIITIVFAMSQAVTVRVGHALGRQQIDSIKLSVYVGILLSFICILTVAIAFTTMPSVFLRIDIDIYDPKNLPLVKEASLLLSIAGILLLFDNIRIITFGALRGLKDTRFSMFTSLLSFWVVGLSISYLFAFTFALDGKGIWWGLTVGIASGAVMVFWRLQNKLKNHPETNPLSH